MLVHTVVTSPALWVMGGKGKTRKARNSCLVLCYVLFAATKAGLFVTMFFLYIVYIYILRPKYHIFYITENDIHPHHIQRLLTLFKTDLEVL